jgi:Tfp pilus assembly protein PilO
MFSPDLIDRYKSKIANLLLIIIFVLISINIYKAQVKNMNSMKERKDVDAKQNKSLEDLSQLQKKIDGLIDFVNNKDISATITNFNNIAKESSIQIISIKPIGEQELPLYVKYPFELMVEATNYHKIGKFISKIESDPSIYAVEYLTMRPVYETQYGSVKKIDTSLKISTFLFKGK